MRVSVFVRIITMCPFCGLMGLHIYGARFGSGCVSIKVIVVSMKYLGFIVRM